MLPSTPPPKKKNSSKVNLTISVIFHVLLIGVMLYLAARQGLLGRQMRTLTVNMEKEKQPEKPKEVEKPKIEQPKVVTPKPEEAKVEEPKAAPPVMAPPVSAPPTVEAPSFDFEGGKTVNSETDPVQMYKGYMEYVLRSKWNRPENMDDDNYVAEVQVGIDKSGNLQNMVWEKGSGNDKWDRTVKDVFNEVHSIDRRPPTNFPPEVTIRFDVEQETEPVMSQ